MAGRNHAVLDSSVVPTVEKVLSVVELDDDAVAIITLPTTFRPLWLELQADGDFVASVETPDQAANPVYEADTVHRFPVSEQTVYRLKRASGEGTVIVRVKVYGSDS